MYVLHRSQAFKHYTVSLTGLQPPPEVTHFCAFAKTVLRDVQRLERLERVQRSSGGGAAATEGT